MPETVLTPVVPVPVQGEALVPLASFIRPFQRHYFSRFPERPNYRARSYDFAGLPALMPLVRAFLDTCAATETADYQYLFTLLVWLAATRSAQPRGTGGSYTLRVHRDRAPSDLCDRAPYAPHHRTTHSRPQGRAGRRIRAGLAMVDALATGWGDNGSTALWLYLPSLTPTPGTTPTKRHVADMKRARRARQRLGPEPPNTHA